MLQKLELKKPAKKTNKQTNKTKFKKKEKKWIFYACRYCFFVCNPCVTPTFSIECNKELAWLGRRDQNENLQSRISFKNAALNLRPFSNLTFWLSSVTISGTGSVRTTTKGVPARPLGTHRFSAWWLRAHIDRHQDQKGPRVTVKPVLNWANVSSRT